MRTSEEIYHRVRWDPRFDPARFVLGVQVRGAAPQRVPLPAFVPGGDVPWHRVLFIEADGEVLWDRATGVDRIDASPAGRVRAAGQLRPPYFSPRTPHRWQPAAGAWLPVHHGSAVGAWLPAHHGPDGAPAGVPLRVLTWNTLWDRYDSDRIDTARRRVLLLAALELADADVLALQEVEPTLAAMLLAEPWVRAGWTVGTDPAGPEVDDTGLLLLSRLPVVEAGWHPLGRHKALAAITVACGPAQPTGHDPGRRPARGPAQAAASAAGRVTVVTTHLTSDHTRDGARVRTGELAAIAGGLAGVDGPLLAVGDFNETGDAPAAALALHDAWRQVHGPDDDTPTFDPDHNPLAAVSSLSGRPARLDRVLLGGGLHATAARRYGDTPATADGLFVSDHYGLLVTVAPAPAPAPPGRDTTG